MTFDLLILGAGPAGLGAAYRAAGSGHKVCVLERSRRVGGAAGSFEIAGMPVDLGSHRLHPSIEPRILADLQELLGNDLQLRRRNGRIRLQGRWISFPLKGREMITAMPPGFVLRAGRDAVAGPLRREPNDPSFASVLRAGLGPTICENFYFPYAHKIWGVDPESLSAEQARRRVTADSPLKILRRAFRGSGSGGAAGAGTFWYPRAGYGQISEALARGAIERGATIEQGAEVTEVIFGEGHPRVVTADSRTFEARNLWSTLPLTLLGRLARPGPAPEARPAVDELRFRSMILVYLVLDRERYTGFDAHYLPEDFTRVTRLSEPKNYRDGDDPKDTTVICAEIPCDRTEDIWTSPPEELAGMVSEGLIAADLPRPEWKQVHVERLPFAYPIYLDGYERWFDKLDEWASRQPGLLTFGRQGLFAHDNLHHALAMSWAAADALGEDGTVDTEAWAAARRRFAAHVVED